MTAHPPWQLSLDGLEARRVERASRLSATNRAPFASGLLNELQLRRDRPVVNSFGSGQHDARSQRQRQRLRCLTASSSGAARSAEGSD